MTFPWIETVTDALQRWSTPFYLAAWPPVAEAIQELTPLNRLGLPVTHWLSLKTQLVKPLLIAACEAGLGAEAISLYELEAARAAGFPNDRILLNGLAKHAWVPDDIPGVRFHFDSLSELERISPDQYRAFQLGARCQIDSGHDPTDRTVGGQFGMTTDELTIAAQTLKRSGAALKGLHFHLRSNIRDAETYERALTQALEMAEAAGVSPEYVDFGGGFPVPGEGTFEASGLERDPLNLEALVGKLSPILARHPGISELWFENGRFLTARSAVLVLTVRDIKERDGCRYVMCDGGRTTNALPSDWEDHIITTIPARTAPEVHSIICGPTCTAYDRLRTRSLPGDVSIGDRIVWFNAGAYHLSWETRFSHGLAKVIWCDDQMRLTLARPEETFDQWWGKWA